MSYVLKSRFLISAWIFCFLLAGIAVAQEAITAHRRTLDELVDESAFIVHGRVIDVKLEPHPEFKNLSTVLVTMQIEDVLKGDVPRTFTFRQFMWDIRSSAHSEYKKRDELLLFLRPPSRIGLTSPAGLSQGKFVIRVSAAGATTAINADNNTGLFATLPKAAKERRAVLPAAATSLASHQGGPVRLDDLKQVVLSLAARAK